MSGHPGAVAHDSARDLYPERWLAAVVLIGGALMDLIDITIVNVALPTIRSDLAASGAQLQWVVSGYMLAFASTLIVSGSFGDVLGRKRVFLVGVAAFGAASLAAGLAQSPGQLIAARVVQGAAAAAMIPQVLATFRAIFAGKERGQVFGMYGAILGFASAFGLILGGLLTSADLFGWSWRTVFLINVPIALVTFLAGVRIVPETRDRAAGRPDVVGAALLTAALVAIAYPLLEGRSLGWPLWIWLVFAAGLVVVAALWIVEERRQHTRVAPLLRTRLFRIPAFGAGLTVQLAFAAGLQGFFLVFAIWLQDGMDFSPLAAGLTTVAFSVGSFLLAGAAIPLALRFGRLVLSAGGLLLGLGTVGVASARATWEPEAIPGRSCPVSSSPARGSRCSSSRSPTSSSPPSPAAPPAAPPASSTPRSSSAARSASPSSAASSSPGSRTKASPTRSPTRCQSSPGCSSPRRCSPVVLPRTAVEEENF